ncbi:MAG: bacillithiol biosynthesis cysteine-adding enzyme BshC [Bryobacteraceae bacterium]
MESLCLRHTELPHTSTLFSDYLYHFERVAAFYDLAPFAPASFRSAARRLDDYPAERRRALVEALREQNDDAAALEKLARPDTVVVATGQQVGLFGGPSYTVYKALTAIRLARWLTDQGTPAVPVFWLASEDHDFAEVNHSWVYGPSHEPVRIYAGASSGDGGPVGSVPVPYGIVDDLRRTLSGFAFADDVTALAGETYVAGRSFAEAFRALMGKLLPGYGLLYLDPLRPAMRELAAPMLRRALESSSELVAKVIERNRALEDAGYHAQVHVEPESSLLFLLAGSRRLPLRRDEDGYRAGTQRVSREQLAERAAQLSPNALLRPVVQDYMLPVAATVVGPGEAAYFAQSQVLYHSLLGRMPVIAPRAGFTLLDSRAERLLLRYGLDLDHFFNGQEAVLDHIASRLVPPGMNRSLSDSLAAVRQQLDRLRVDLSTFDSTLVAAFEKSRRKIVYQFEKLERKAAREALRRDERARSEATFLNGLIYPEKHLQERLYSILPFLAKHGFDIVGRIYENIAVDGADHQILVL